MLGKTRLMLCPPRLAGYLLGSVTVESLVWITGHIVGMVEEAANPKHLLPFGCSSLVDAPVVGVHG